MNWLRSSLLMLALWAPFCVGDEEVPTDAFAEELDSYFENLVDDRRASGVAAAVMLDGRLLFSRGYGFADAERRTPVDPDRTPFSIGSVSKTLTATAIGLLLESGEIRSLEDPVNRYLKRIQLPADNGKEIIIQNLLTHQAGLEDSVFGLLANGSIVPPLSADEIEARIPEFMDDVGEVSVYSNIGFGILGILIEDISGLTLKQFLDERVFAPLGMTRTTVRYDPNVRLAAPAKFRSDGTTQVIPQNWAYHPFIAPSASVVSTAHDMTLFLQANLTEGQDAMHAISPEVWKRMRQPLAGNHPEVSAFGMSLFIHDHNGATVVENAGSGPGFQAVLIMLPERRSGLIALIMGGGEVSTVPEKLMGMFGDPKVSAVNMFEVRQKFLEGLLGTYRPEPRHEGNEPRLDPTGLYRSSRRPHGTAEVLLSPGLSLSVKREPNGRYTINGEGGYAFVSPSLLWKEGIAPFVGSAARSDTYAIHPDGEGGIAYITPHLSIDVYRPVMVSPNFARISGIILLLLGAGGLWAFRGRVKTRLDRYAKYTLIGVGLGCVGLITIIGFSGVMGINPVFQLAFGSRTWFMTVIALSNLTAVFAVLSGVLLTIHRQRARDPQSSSGSPGGKAGVLACVASILLIPVFDYFNLLGLNLP